MNAMMAEKVATGQCPYASRPWRVCGASFSRVVANTEMGTELCFSASFDDCPLFLAKLLRTAHYER